MTLNRKTYRVRRRTLLGAGLAAAAAGAAVSFPRWFGNSNWRFLSAGDAATLNAVCERLIPADRDPGAAYAGVINYIDIQLGRHFKRHRQAYRQGLAAIENHSRAKFSSRFVDLSPGQQVEVLKLLEENSGAFFDLLLMHTRQGFYGDPRHGGNRGMVSWKMVGVPFPPVRGRMHYDEPSKTG